MNYLLGIGFGTIVVAAAWFASLSIRSTANERLSQMHLTKGRIAGRGDDQN